jgi:hypothetical protein
MNDAKSRVITWAFSLIPYLLVTWGYTEFTDGGLKEFGIAFCVLFGIRLFFTVIETIGGILAWRLYGRQNTVQRMVTTLRANNFPMRKYFHDDFGNYLARIDDEEEYPQAIRGMAKEIDHSLELFDELGAFAGWRYGAAWNAALDIYSPRENAPHLQFPDKGN